MITLQLAPWEFDIVSSALALYAEEGDDMGDRERDQVRAIHDRLEAQLEANEDSGQEERSYYADGPCRFEDSPRYRADMTGAGRGRLVR